MVLYSNCIESSLMMCFHFETPFVLKEFNIKSKPPDEKCTCYGIKNKKNSIKSTTNKKTRDNQLKIILKKINNIFALSGA